MEIIICILIFSIIICVMFLHKTILNKQKLLKENIALINELYKIRQQNKDEESN